MYFWAILRVAVFSYPVGGQVFPKVKLEHFKRSSEIDFFVKIRTLWETGSDAHGVGQI